MAERIADNAELIVDEMRRKARRRLVGAIVLALAAAIILPMLLEKEPRPLGDDVSVQIPPIDQGKFVNRLTGKAGETKAPAKADSKPITAPSGKAETKAEATADGAANPMKETAVATKGEPPSPKAESAAASKAETPGATKGDAAVAASAEAKGDAKSAAKSDAKPATEGGAEPKTSVATAAPTPSSSASILTRSNRSVTARSPLPDPCAIHVPPAARRTGSSAVTRPLVGRRVTIVPSGDISCTRGSRFDTTINCCPPKYLRSVVCSRRTVHSAVTIHLARRAERTTVRTSRQKSTC